MTVLSPGDFYRTKDGACLYHQVKGDGIPLVLLHGWSSSSKIFARNIPDLTRRFKVVTFDYRGHGYSSKLLTGHTCEQYAKDLKDLTDHLNIGPFILAGWSMGVTIALTYIRLFGEDDLLGTILIDGSSCPFATADWNRGNLQGYDMDALIAKMNLRLHDYLALMSGEPKKDAADESLAKNPFASEVVKTPIWISYAIYNDYMMQDNTDVLKSLKKPLMVMVPKENLERGRYEAGFSKNSELCIFDTSHALFYDDSGNFNHYISRFADKILKD